MILGGNLGGIVTNGLIGNFQSIILGKYNLNLFEIEIVVEPSNPGSAGSTDPKEYKIFMTLKFNGQIIKKTYTINDGPAYVAIKNSKFKSKPFTIKAKFLK